MNKSYWQNQAEDYALYRPTYPEKLATTLAGLTSHHNLAVDIGCGTGQLTNLLTPYFKKVIGVDVSFNQLEEAKKASNIDYLEGSAEKIPCQDKSANLIVAAQAAHWFDLPLFYKEAKRIAKGNAILAFITYGVMHVEGPAKKRINDFYWKDIHAFWPKDREKVETGYKNLPFPFEAPTNPLPVLTIEREWPIHHFISYCKTWSAYKKANEAGKSTLLSTLETDLYDLIGKDGVLKITWPITLKAGIINPT